MERAVFYYGSALDDRDLNNVGQKTMVALGKLAEAVLGTNAATLGLGVSPATGLTVTIAPGQLYQVEPLEATVLSDLPANNTHFIVKQALLLDPQTLTGFSAPVGAGTSVNYLIEAQYQDQDIGAVVLGFYDADNPQVQFSGPGNTGGTTTTIRKGAIAFQVKAGAAATSGTQTTPSPDSGWSGIAAVTVAQGATSLSSGNIAAYSGNPGIPTTLPAIPGQIQAQSFVAWPDTGTANNYVINPVPPITSAPAGTRFGVSIGANNANTGASNLTVSGVTMNIAMNDRTAIGQGYIAGNMQAAFTSDGVFWQLEAPATVAYGVGGGVVSSAGAGLAYQLGLVI